MRYIIRKSVGVLLILLTLLSTLTGCLKRKHIFGDIHITGEFLKIVNAQIVTNKVIFEKEDVTFDFYYALYPLLWGNTIENVENTYGYTIEEWNGSKYEVMSFESDYAIYLSNSDQLVFEDNLFNDSTDYEKVNAKMYKFISFEEAFGNDYGFTRAEGNMKIKYHHSEKITIPAEFFNSSSECVYVHIVRFIRNVCKGTSNITSDSTIVSLKFNLLCENIVVIH